MNWPNLQKVSSVAVFIACWVVAATALPAADPQIHIAVGFDGVCKVGHWVPVQVQITAGDRDLSGTLEISAPDGDGTECLFLAEQHQNITIPARQQRTFSQQVRLGRTRGEIEARLRQDKRTVVAARVTLGRDVTALASTQHWLLVVGEKIRIDSVTGRYRLGQEGRLRITAVEDSTKLPSAWYGYEGVDTIVLTTSRKDLVENLSTEQLNALKQWVRMGGTLLLSLGANAPVLAGPGGPLEAFVTQPVQATTEISEAPGLESMARAEKRLDEFTLAVLPESAGEVVCFVEERSRGQQVAIVRAPWGFGVKVILAFDLGAAPFNEWPHTGFLLNTLLLGETVRDENPSDETRRGRVQHIGFDEMSGQLRSALDHFPGTADRPAVAVVTFWTVFPLLLVYMALLGPGDYFFLRRFIRRMEMTWITFPLLIVATSSAIFVIGKYWRGGSHLRVNQVDLVDIDLHSEIVRGTTWTQVYTPASAQFDLSIDASAAASAESTAGRGDLLTWQGLPGNGLGGFDTTNVEIVDSAPYLSMVENNGAECRIEKLLLPTSTSKGFLGRWWREEEFAAPPAIQVDHNGVLHGTITNPLSVPLMDAMVAHDQWVYRLDETLDAGQSIRLDDIQRRDLEWRLTRRRVLQSTTSYTSAPWDSQSRDVQRIMEIMMFYDAAGGKNYTGLGQRYQPFVDLSEQLQLGQAILIGRSQKPAVHIRDKNESLTDQAEQTWTWYRILLPVERAASAPSSIDLDDAEGVLH